MGLLVEINWFPSFFLALVILVVGSMIKLDSINSAWSQKETRLDVIIKGTKALRPTGTKQNTILSITNSCLKFVSYCWSLDFIIQYFRLRYVALYGAFMRMCC